MRKDTIIEHDKSIKKHDKNIKDITKNANDYNVETGTDDQLSNIANAINSTGKTLLVPEGEYTTSQLDISVPQIIKGNNTTLNGFNASNTTNFNVKSGDVKFQDLKINGNTVQTLCTGSDGIKNIELNNNELTGKNIGIHFNNDALENIKVVNNNINVEGFGLLLNDKAKTGSNLLIKDNVIVSDKADAIELNTPNENGDNGFRGIKVMSNTLTVNNGATGVTAGFAIGIAQAKDISVVGNIIETSRNEAIHIEDTQENITVIGNVLNDCLSNGAKILPRNRNGIIGKPVIFSGNQVKQKDLAKTGYGVQCAWTSDGIISSCVVTNNVIRGFNVGLFLDGATTTNIDGNTITDCNTAIQLGVDGTSSGKIICKNCPTLAIGQTGAVFDKIISETTPTTILTYSGTNGYIGATLKGFKFPLTQYTTKVGTNLIDIFIQPTRMNGTLTAKIRSNYDFIFLSADVSYDGTTLTVSNKIYQQNGNLTSPNFVLNNNKIYFSVNDIGTRTLNYISVDFDGIYYKSN